MGDTSQDKECRKLQLTREQMSQVPLDEDGQHVPNRPICLRLMILQMSTNHICSVTVVFVTKSFHQMQKSHL